MEILIKNMVCRHCMAAVRQALEQLGLDVRSVKLGHAEFEIPSDADKDTILENIDRSFVPLGFERITDSDTATVERVKSAVLHHIRDEHECRFNLSACIEEHVGMNYDQASRIFSRVEGRTVERYSILQKIEYVKELLGYGDRTLAEIADVTGYSSAAHLSRQFKDVTGMTPTQYIRSSSDRRKSLDEV